MFKLNERSKEATNPILCHVTLVKLAIWCPVPSTT